MSGAGGKRNLQNQRKNRALGTDYPVSAPRPFLGIIEDVTGDMMKNRELNMRGTMTA